MRNRTAPQAFDDRQSGAAENRASIHLVYAAPAHATPLAMMRNAFAATGRAARTVFFLTLHCGKPAPPRRPALVVNNGNLPRTR